MATPKKYSLKKYSLAGKELGTIEIDERIATAEANGQMIKDYIVALRANARQWSASTKGRSEVAHTTKKPRPQKGTGNARQGSLVGPQFRGGGIVFGPKPKFDQHVRINKKERQAAIRCLLAEKIRDNRLIIIDDTKMKEPKTKKVSHFMDACKLDGRVLFVVDSVEEVIKTADKKDAVLVKSNQHENFQKSIRNIPLTEVRHAKNISGYDLLLAGDLVVTEEALKQITEWLI